MSDLQTKLEEPSKIERKLTITVPANMVDKHYHQNLTEVQKQAKIKGFRPGKVPLNVVKRHYGKDVVHRALDSVVNEAYREALGKHSLNPVGRANIDTGGHTHDIEGKDLTFTATFEVMPEIKLKSYKGFKFNRDSVEVTDKDLDQLINQVTESRAQLVPVSSGLTDASGNSLGKPAEKGHFVDCQFKGAVKTAEGLQEREDMAGSRMIEIGSNSFIPGFEDQLIGMKSGETKTFDIKFPEDYGAEELKGADAQFTVTLGEIKTKEIPSLDDELAKEMGYENVEDMKTKARDHLMAQKVDEADRKLRGEVIGTLVDKNPFDVPKSMVQAQASVLAREFSENLKRQGANEEMAQKFMGEQLEGIMKRAEGQVRASLILDEVSKAESLKVTPEMVEKEYEKLAAQTQLTVEKVKEYYAKPEERENLEFRLLEDMALQFVMENSKVKQA